MEYNVQKIIASRPADVVKNTIILNKDQLEDIMHVYISPEIARDFKMFEIHELTDSGLVELDIPENVKMMRNWVDINMSALNQKSGQHSYRISLFNKSANTVVSLYFSYIIQDDNPDKPYVYMDGSNKCTVCCKCK